MLLERGLRLMCTASIAVVVLTQTPAATAAGWESPLGRCEVVMPYGAACVSGIHRGIDLAASAGAEVRAPVGGRVAFAGTVPADGGGTCYAVTIDVGDGLKLSLLPLEAVTVGEGDVVSPDDVIGGLASAGDDSWGETHLHLGLRRADVYLDPTGYLPAAASAAPDEGGHNGETSSDGADGVNVGAPVGQGAAAAPAAGHASARSAPVSSAPSVGAAIVAATLEPAASAPVALTIASPPQVGRTTAVMDRLRDAPLVPSTLQPVAMSVPRRPLVAPIQSAVRPLMSALLALGMCGTAAGIAHSRKLALARTP